MTGFYQIRIYSILLFLAVFSSMTTANACVTPVYRYALENWTSDPYRITVFYDRPFEKGELEKIEPIALAGMASYGRVPFDLDTDDSQLKSNVTIRFAHLNEEMDPATQKLWELQKNAELPWVVIRYPRLSKKANILWQGPLERLDGSPLLNSPSRDNVADYLINGETAVWILLTTGDKVKDEKALETLKNGLSRSEKELKLPFVPENERENTLSGTTAALWRVSFKIVSIPRSDRSEVPFITMLIKSNPDLMKHLKEPMAFAIFGKGRVFSSLAGDAITESSILKANSFLLGSCQCDIKEQNPGTDLIFPDRWAKVLENLPAESPTTFPLIGYNDADQEDATESKMQATGAAEEASAIKDQTTSASPVHQSKYFSMTLPMIVLISIGVIFIAVFLGSMVIKSKNRE